VRRSSAQVPKRHEAGAKCSESFALRADPAPRGDVSREASLSVRFIVGEIEIRPAERQVLAGDQPLALGGRAFDLLMCLIEHRDRVVAKRELMDRVWPGQVVEESNLTVQMSALRKLLGPAALVTVQGRGYRFAGPLRSCEAPSPTVDESALPLPDKPSIAVLPFDNLGGDPDDDALIDGIAEDVITELSRYRTLFVIARNSSFSYKGRSVDVRTVARELGVQYVLEGSVRRAGRRVRVTGQLIDALSGAHLWAERFDREVTDALDLQAELTAAIVGAIGWQIDSSELRRARHARAGSPTAHGLAMQARIAARRGIVESDRASFEEALRLGDKALAVDPQCAAAWREQTLAIWGLIMLGAVPSVEQALDTGMAVSRKVLEIDSQDHDVHVWRGLLLSHAGDPNAGLAEFRRAHELNPNDPMALTMLGQYEAGAGDPASGLLYTRAALRLSPRDPMMWFQAYCGAMASFFAGDYERAVAGSQDAVVEAPNFFNAHQAMSLALVGAGRVVEARTHCRRMGELSPPTLQSRLDGHWPYAHPPFVERARIFLRIAVGLEPPAAADAVR
jgi:TolB-like protein/Flp pilus assembly protein TadD